MTVSIMKAGNKAVLTSDC